MGLFDLFSNDSAEEAAAQKKAGLQQGYDSLSSLYGQGRDAATTGYNTASNLYANLGQTYNNLYGGGASAYADASGANGVSGLQSAMDTFKNSGQYGNYGFSLDQGLQALDRTHAAAGNLNSGNADTDAMKYATGLANQTYSSYLSGLQPYLSLAGQGAALSTQGQASAATGLGNALNTSYTGQGTAANANYSGQGAADAAATMNNYNVGANQLNALLGVASVASGGLGGSLGGALTGGFGGSGFSLGPTSVGGAPVSGGLFSAFS